MSEVRGYPVNLVTVHMNSYRVYIVPSRPLVNYGPSIVKLMEETFLCQELMQRRALTHAFSPALKD